MTLPHEPGHAHDPGYLGSLTSYQAPLTFVRHLALALVMSPPLLWVAVPVLGLDPTKAPAWGLLLIAIMVAGAMAVGRLVAETVEPLDPQTPEDTAAAAAVGAFRRQVLLQLAVAEVPVCAGFLLALATGSLVLWITAFLLGWPLLLLGLPTTGTVERLREQLEARGADSHIWAALLRSPGARA